MTKAKALMVVTEKIKNKIKDIDVSHRLHTSCKIASLFIPQEYITDFFHQFVVRERDRERER